MVKPVISQIFAQQIFVSTCLRGITTLSAGGN